MCKKLNCLTLSRETTRLSGAHKHLKVIYLSKLVVLFGLSAAQYSSSVAVSTKGKTYAFIIIYIYIYILNYTSVFV